MEMIADFWRSLSGDTTNRHTDATTAISDSNTGKADGSISGRFDPTALERGAKALREIDASPNATKAFELTKQQEYTRQKSIDNESEKCRLKVAQSQTERVRTEAEERRKFATHHQEQERITTQYKAQIEAELHSKKLQDQQRQNDELIKQQDEQFVRQENTRIANEQQLLDIRRTAMSEENLLQQEIMKMKIREKTKGRIQQERQNIDLKLTEIKLKAEETRRTKLQIIDRFLTSTSNALISLIDDRRKLAAVIGGCTAAAFGIYGARSGTRVAANYVESRLGKPQMIRETSRRMFLSRGLSMRLNIFRRFAKFPIWQETLILPEDLSERLQWSTNSILSSKKLGIPPRHILLHGPPGTGKTLFARTLARQSGMDYAILSGGDVGPLGRHAVTELNKVFKWSNNSRKGVILLIDEADAFLRQGRSVDIGTGATSEEMRNVLSAFLYHTSTATPKLCVVLATNIRGVLDKAVLDRIDDQFEFPLPGLNERREMLRMFTNEYITTPTKRGKRIKLDAALDDKFWIDVAKKTDGFSGRQLAKLVRSLQSAAFGVGSNILTRGIADTVVLWKIAHDKET